MAKVSMYTLSTCPVCRKTSKIFPARGIIFDFVSEKIELVSSQA